MRVVPVIFASFAALLFACAGESTEDEIEESLDELNRVVGEGQICAGGTAAASCEEGLRCVRSGRVGRCRVDPNASRGASENEICGGARDIQCREGLTCRRPAGSSPNARGVCKRGQSTCLAMPACDEGDETVASESDCPQDASCYKRTMCGRTMWCSGAGDGESALGQPCSSGMTDTCPAPFRCSVWMGQGGTCIR